MTNMYKAGVLSLLTIFLWAVSNIFLRYSVLEFGCNQFAIACSNVLFSGLAMIFLGNHRTDVLKIITNYQTWVFGALQIFRNFTMIMAFVYVSSTEANLLANIEIVFSVMVAWMWFHRRPSRVDVFSMLLIFIGCAVLVMDLPIKIMAKVAAFVCASAFLNVLRTVVAEVYKDNKSQMSIKDRLSMTGWIMVVSAFTFVLVAALLGLLVSYLPPAWYNNLPFLKTLPEPSEYIALNNILCGMVNGIVFYAASMYCYLYAVSLSTSEYFMMYRSTQAVFTYIVEFTVSFFTALPFANLNVVQWFAALLVILSSACMVLMRSANADKLKIYVNNVLHAVHIR